MQDMSFVPCAGTFSKSAHFYGARFPFQYITNADGAYIQGNDSKWYLDWVSGLGASLYGYANYEINTYVQSWLARGNGLSLPSEIEYSAAEKLAGLLSANVPGWSGQHLQARWVTSGSEACAAAIRLARAVTGKQHILSYGYHGGASDFVAMTPPAHGIPKATSSYMSAIKYGSIPDLDFHDGSGNIAAVILEQGLEEPSPDYYPHLRKFCDDNQCLLIMDEVVTGLRYGLCGASGLYGVLPDLVCMGKAISAGHPLAALVGPKQYMDWFARVDPVFVSSTNAGNVGGLAAADWILSHWTQRSVDYIWQIGAQLITGMNEAGVTTIGHAPRSLLMFVDDYEKAYFIWGMAQRGYVMNRPNFPTMAHVKSLVERTLSAAREVQGEIEKLGPEGLRAEIAEHELPFVLFRNR